ncbi:MAG: hypothetical protein KatS3mg115_0788 [Candidatus Poribacteria bacterium]|nr:MAG: hypothetical protein KatS3mg115_0788 [Candidatus Poribacteria bacterium]
MGTRKKRRQKSSRSALLVSLIVHLALALAITVTLATRVERQTQQTPAFEVALIPPIEEPKTPVKPLPRFVRSAAGSQPSPDWKSVAVPRPETIQFAQRPVVEVVVEEEAPIEPELALLTTAAEHRSPSERPVATASRTAARPTPGAGQLGPRQIPGGELRGARLLESTGVAAVGVPGGNARGTGTAGRGVGEGRIGDPFADALARIGESIAQGSPSGRADVLFVIDASGSMHDNIAAVADNLYSLTDALTQEGIDFRLSVVQFRELETGNRIEMTGWSSDPETLRQQMRAMGVLGNERALDALVQALSLRRFRADADRHLVLVTDEPVSTRWKEPRAAEELKARILSEAIENRLHIQVLGAGEAFQRELAIRTGGLFQPIPSGASHRGAEPDYVSMRPQVLEPIFRQLAGDLIRWVQPNAGGESREVDVVLVVDVSRSMLGRLRAVMYGVSLLDSVCQMANVVPTYYVVRVATSPELTGNGVPPGETHVVSPALSTVERVQQELAFAAAGDEYLIDALQAVLSTPPGRKGTPKAFVVVSDEPPSARDGSAETIASLLAEAPYWRVWAILPGRSIGRPDPITDRLVGAFRATGGRVFTMPAGFDRRIPNR